MITANAPDGCCVRLIDLPYSVGAMVALDENGYASIYINARQSYEKQKKCLRHELRHLQYNDMFNNKSIYEVECGNKTEHHVIEYPDDNFESPF